VEDGRGIAIMGQGGGLVPARKDYVMFEDVITYCAKDGCDCEADQVLIKNGRATPFCIRCIDAADYVSALAGVNLYLWTVRIEDYWQDHGPYPDTYQEHAQLKLARKSYKKMVKECRAGLAAVRKQLTMARTFAENTPSDGKPHHDALWWAGEFPEYVDEYDPRKWVWENRAFWMIWSDYISELEQAGLTVYAEQAKQLPIGDLLAASKTADAEEC